MGQFLCGSVGHGSPPVTHCLLCYEPVGATLVVLAPRVEFAAAADIVRVGSVWHVAVTATLVAGDVVVQTARVTTRLQRHGHITDIRHATVWYGAMFYSLPDFIRDPRSNTDCFRCLLKTYLFTRY